MQFHGIKYIYTALHPSPSSISRTISSSQIKTLYPLTLTPLYPQPLTITILLSVPMNLTTLGTSDKWTHANLSFGGWFISLCIILSARFTYDITCYRISFVLTLNNIPLYMYTTFCFSIYLSVDTWFASTFWLL